MYRVDGNLAGPAVEKRIQFTRPDQLIKPGIAAIEHPTGVFGLYYQGSCV
jgi:hypothetical protein